MIVPQSPKKTCELQLKGITLHVLQSVKVNLGREIWNELVSNFIIDIKRTASSVYKVLRKWISAH